jgi:hypothetical protein
MTDDRGTPLGRKGKPPDEPKASHAAERKPETARVEPVVPVVAAPEAGDVSRASGGTGLGVDEGRGDAVALAPVDASDTRVRPGPSGSGARAPIDVVYIHGPTESGEALHVLRQRDDRIEVGQIRGLRPGAPIHGELVRLRPREGTERLFDVDVLLAAPEHAVHAGPPQVASNAYRHNWDLVFGSAAERRKARDPEPN